MVNVTKLNSSSADRHILPGRNRQGRLFFRDNPKGVHFERWSHHYGCRQWFNVARHTVSHEILAVYGIDEAAPDIDPGEVV